MYENKITIVTAFFPLKREEWTGFERSNDKYIENFKFWARIQNDMIIYTDKEYSESIKKVREDFGRKNTKIIIIDDFEKIDVELYNSMQNITKNEISKEFRLMPNNPEVWNTDYDYIMLLKEWCVKDAVEKGHAKGMIAWVDFGYNHGGKYYINPEEFDFEWKYNFTNKIHLFQINEYDNLPIFEVCRRMNSYFIGGVIIAPDYLWDKLWNMVRNNMITLNKCGIVDDDQTLLLMSYLEDKELFEIHPCKWFSVIKDFSDNNFTIIEDNKRNINFANKTRSKLAYRKRIKRYLKKWYEILKNEELKG